MKDRTNELRFSVLTYAAALRTFLEDKEYQMDKSLRREVKKARDKLQDLYDLLEAKNE